MQFIDKYRFLLIIALLFGLFLLISLGNKVKQEMVARETNTKDEKAQPVTVSNPEKNLNPIEADLQISDTLQSSMIELSTKKEIVVVVY